MPDQNALFFTTHDLQLDVRPACLPGDHVSLAQSLQASKRNWRSDPAFNFQFLVQESRPQRGKRGGILYLRALKLATGFVHTDESSRLYERKQCNTMKQIVDKDAAFFLLL